MADTDSSDFICCGCSKQLREVYGHCVSCPKNTVICQRCLARGAEFGCHKNNHQVVSMRLDFPVLEAGWTAAEELDLLDALVRFGPHNWNDVSKHVGPTRSADEVKDHYVRAYQNDHQYRITPAFIAHRASLHDPPRFPSTSILYGAFSGYNAARGDFQVDYDNDAEQCVSGIDARLIREPCEAWGDEERRLDSSLFFATVDSYRRRLIERERRHGIIGEHGLIQPQKNYLWLRRFDDSNKQWFARDRFSSARDGVNNQLAKVLVKFAQFLSGTELDMLLEGLKLESDLRASLFDLYELRRNGIRNLRMMPVFRTYSQRREEFLREHRKYMLNPYYNWRQTCDARAREFPQLISRCRRPAPPLNISKLPGCDRLDPKERDLCSVARIVPESYLEFKNILVAECLKQGGLRLAQARTLIKIDVNKTRKLYNFLIDEGLIYQPSVS